MAWENKPTYNQIQTIFRWLEWHMSRDEASKATKWLEQNATRKDASKEIDRLYPLYKEHKLNKEECFNSEIWAKYKESEEKK